MTGSHPFFVQVNPSLQLLESCRVTVAVERDDLAVEDEGHAKRARPLFQGARNLGKLRGFFVAEAGPEAHAPPALRHLDDRANAIVLGFVDELRIAERCVGERGEHGLQHAGIRRRLSVLETHHFTVLQSAAYRSLNHGSAEFE